MTEKSSSWLGYYLLVGLIWGCSFLFIAVGNEFLPSTGVAFWRLALGGVAMLLLALIQRKKLPREPRTWGLLFLVSIFMNSAPSFLFAFAEQHVTSAFAGIMNATTPIATVIMILTIFREEKPEPKVLVGLGVGLAGVLTVLAIWEGFGATDIWAVLALVFAVTLYGIGGPFARRYVSPLKLDATTQVAVQVILAAVTLAPFYVFGPLTTSAPTAIGVLVMVAFGVLGTGFAYIWYYRLMALGGSAIANSVTYLSPVVAVLVGAWVLHEAVTWNQIVGGAIVILGAAISQGRLDGLLRVAKRSGR